MTLWRWCMLPGVLEYVGYGEQLQGISNLEIPENRREDDHDDSRPRSIYQ